MDSGFNANRNDVRTRQESAGRTVLNQGMGECT